MGIRTDETSESCHETSSSADGGEIEMTPADVERLKQLLPQQQLEQLQATPSELSQLEIILQAIKYIRSLQEDLSEQKDEKVTKEKEEKKEEGSNS